MGGLRGLVQSFKFHENRSSAFGDVWVFGPFPLFWPLAYTIGMCDCIRRDYLFVD